ncbi:hypothetical protein BS47DRAFT_1387604 [Hydnum rufescens UP504]|uniref:PHD-type domain-containing protein n=1 Tax=Hydnum rufescens UP504 TaxID=1448309 RepID=A0A9P6E1W3_9AGAM|nr:hypothetical protein BS47DRAFT_1387604 [Hydnum rufescens UP504]
MSVELAGAAAFADGPYAPILTAPVHIEGSDPSLATEVLPPPPTLAFIRLPMNKRPGDLSKRPLPSFLPRSDPGTTYATHTVPTPMVISTSSGVEDQGTPHAPSASSFLSQVTRLQRNSARLNIPLPPSNLPDEQSKVSLSAAGPSTPALSISNDDESPIAPDMPNESSFQSPAKRARGRPRKAEKDSKTDGIEIDGEPEPDAPKEAVFRNDDICACCSVSHSNSTASPLSHFLYCDGCTRSFHMGCLDPPIMDDEDLPPPEKDWFCPSCIADKTTPPRLPRNPGLFDLLVYQQQQELPKVFQLPEEIRGYFKDVAIGPQGAYLDISELKAGRANRHGFLEERDPYRLKDRNNNLITCYRCSRSAAPRFSLESGVSVPSKAGTRRPSEPRKAKLAADAAIQSNQSMISCDYCNLHWHLDCLDPPLTTMPPTLKKWMCPNHAENAMPPRRSVKTPRIVEVKERGMRNNGNIEIIPSAEDMASEQDGRYDEIWINSKKYMIPERTIRLDFLDKATQRRNPGFRSNPPPPPQPPPTVASSRAPSSSPLTSLSSLSDDDERRRDMADMDAAISSRPSDTAQSLLLLHPENFQALETSQGAFPIQSSLMPSISTDTSLPNHRNYPPTSSTNSRAHSSSVSRSAPHPPPLPSSSISRTSTESPFPLGETHVKDVKAGSTATSFRIRLNRSTAASTAQRPPTNQSPAPPPPISNGELGRDNASADPEIRALPPALPNANGVAALALLTPREIEQLLHIRNTILVKGEQKLLEFLASE